MKQRLLFLPLVAAVAGCASIVKGGAQEIHINSNVPDAQFEIRNNLTNAVQLKGVTPATISLQRGAGYFKKSSYTVTISKDGYETQQIPVTGSVNGWYAGGNLLIGGLIGYLIVDPATGAMWELNPPLVHPTLVAVKPPMALPAEGATPAEAAPSAQPAAAPAATEPAPAAEPAATPATTGAGS